MLLLKNQSSMCLSYIVLNSILFSGKASPLSAAIIMFSLDGNPVKYFVN